MIVPTVVCVLRSGGDYTDAHVLALYDGVSTHWPKGLSLRFVVLTDGDVGLWETSPVVGVALTYGYVGWWSKLELFKPENDYLGDILYFDLDTVILGDLADIVVTRVLTLLSDFYKPKSLASGMMYLPLASRLSIWQLWAAKVPEEHMWRTRGDQDFLRKVLLAPDFLPERWQLLWPGQVVSYKLHCSKPGKVPEGARVVCFHGRPRPWQLETPLGVAIPEAASIHEERWADVVDDDRGGPYVG